MRIWIGLFAAAFAITSALADEGTPKAGIDALVDESLPSNSADISPDEVWDMLGDHIRQEEEKNGYSIDERTKAMAQASVELTRAQIVNVQEETIRRQMEKVPEEHRGTFLNGSMADLAQCSSFRLAQALSIKKRDASASSVVYEQKATHFETHLYLTAQAVGRILNNGDYEQEARRQYKDNVTTWMATHYESLTYQTDAQKAHYDGWDGKCTKITDVLTNGLEKRARERVTTAAVEARTDEILAELVASRR